MRRDFTGWVEPAGNGISTLFGVAVLITSYEVVMRYVFSAPTTWVHELATAMSAFAFAYGGPYAMLRDAHMRISTLYDRPGRVRRVGVVTTAVAGVIYLGGLMYGFAVKAYEAGWRFEGGLWIPETTGRTFDVPIPPFLYLATALCCLLFLALVLRQFIGLMKEKA